MFDILCCPVCGKPLYPGDRSFYCSSGHCFDRGRSGYVHLLPANHQHARLPGDNPEMVRARRRFLEQGYYGHLLTALTEAVKGLPENGILLDAGCGEGWYTKGMGDALRREGKAPEVIGVDISKMAADLAARRDKAALYAVGSVFRLPVQEKSCDMLTSVFAPYCGTEFRRVLKTGGTLILAIPAARHLWELKAAIYDDPYENTVKSYELEGFSFVKKISAERRISLLHSQDIQDLFSMTPYAYRTKPAERERLNSLHTLETLASFEVLLYTKQSLSAT